MILHKGKLFFPKATKKENSNLVNKSLRSRRPQACYKPSQGCPKLPQLFAGSELQLLCSAESTHRSKSNENRGLCRRSRICVSVSHPIHGTGRRAAADGSSRPLPLPCSGSPLQFSTPSAKVPMRAHIQPLDVYLTLTPGKRDRVYKDRS